MLHILYIYYRVSPTTLQKKLPITVYTFITIVCRDSYAILNSDSKKWAAFCFNSSIN